MAETQLDAFLAGGGAPAPVETPQEPPAEQPAPTTEPEAPEAPAASQEPPEGEPEHGEATNFRKLRDVVETTKREREDYKSRAIRAETQAEELRKQLEAPRQEQRQAPPPQMDIREAMAQDPAIKAAVLTRLDTSEMLLRERLGDDAVNQLQQDFTAAMARDPTLQAKVLVQRDPYRWAMKHLESIKLYDEIGDDPAGWREKQRALWEAERANGATTQQPRVSPAAGMAPSLASARSAAPRSAPAWSGPRPLESIVGDIRRR
jgi:hypothetical protein